MNAIILIQKIKLHIKDINAFGFFSKEMVQKSKNLIKDVRLYNSRLKMSELTFADGKNVDEFEAFFNEYITNDSTGTTYEDLIEHWTVALKKLQKAVKWRSNETPPEENGRYLVYALNGQESENQYVLQVAKFDKEVGWDLPHISHWTEISEPLI